MLRRDPGLTFLDSLNVIGQFLVNTVNAVDNFTDIVSVSNSKDGL